MSLLQSARGRITLPVNAAHGLFLLSLNITFL
jgi:hypothetical protein